MEHASGWPNQSRGNRLTAWAMVMAVEAGPQCAAQCADVLVAVGLEPLLGVAHGDQVDVEGHPLVSGLVGRDGGHGALLAEGGKEKREGQGWVHGGVVQGAELQGGGCGRGEGMLCSPPQHVGR